MAAAIARAGVFQLFVFIWFLLYGMYVTVRSRSDFAVTHRTQVTERTAVNT